MNEEKSDFMFVVEGQPIPAVKAFLSVKSRVFSAMFSKNFKESKDKEKVIEDTTYEAFKTLIRFLYCDDLVLKDDNDFELIVELYRLSKYYDVYKLFVSLTDKLLEKSQSLLKIRFFDKEKFEEVWPQIQCFLKIAFEYKIEKLMDNVMEFMYKRFDYFILKDNEVLIQINNATDGRLFAIMVDKSTDDEEVRHKIIEIMNLMSKKVEKIE